MLQFLYKIRVLLPIVLLVAGFFIGFGNYSAFIHAFGILFCFLSGYFLATIGYLTVRKNAKAQEKSK